MSVRGGARSCGKSFEFFPEEVGRRSGEGAQGKRGFAMAPAGSPNRAEGRRRVREGTGEASGSERRTPGIPRGFLGGGGPDPPWRFLDGGLDSLGPRGPHGPGDLGGEDPAPSGRAEGDSGPGLKFPGAILCPGKKGRDG